MRTYAFATLLLGYGVLGSACVEDSQTEVSYEARAIPSVAPTLRAGEWTVTLRVAQLVFGPVYFCAASTGIDRCEPAQSELLSIATIDLLDSTPRSIGVVHGYTGSIRSAAFDFGLTWFPTQSAVTVATANSLGHSAYFEGEAQRGSDVVRFAATVDLPPQFRGQHAVVSSAAIGRVSARTERLDVVIDYAEWFSQVDFGKATASEMFEIVPNTPEHSGLVQGMTSRSPIRFEWSP